MQALRSTPKNKRRALQPKTPKHNSGTKVKQCIIECQKHFMQTAEPSF
jgi:hypothetical protein